MAESKLHDSLPFLLTQAHRRIRAGLSRSVSDSDFTEENWRILRILADEQGRSMGQLAEQAILNGPALTKNIDKLVSRGVVLRAADPEDNRKVLVFISDVGLDLLERWQHQIDSHQSGIEQALGARKASQLKKLLAQLIQQSASG